MDILIGLFGVVLFFIFMAQIKKYERDANNRHRLPWDDYNGKRHTLGRFKDAHENDENEVASAVWRSKMEPASEMDWDTWVRDYNQNLPDWLRWDSYCTAVATSDSKITPLYGASSMVIIFPKGVKFLGGELGHNTVLYYDEDGNAQLAD